MQRDNRRNDFFNFQNVPTQTLVVVNKMKIIGTWFQFSECTLRECQWFGKLSGEETRSLYKVWP